MTPEEINRVEHIKSNLNTRPKWTKQDYVDFYERDIVFLLGLIAALEAVKEGK